MKQQLLQALKGYLALPVFRAGKFFRTPFIYVLVIISLFSLSLSCENVFGTLEDYNSFTIYVLTPEGWDMQSNSNYQYNMGNAVNGSTPKIATFIIGNRVNADLNIGSVSLSDNTNYYLDPDEIIGEISAGSEATLTVKFQPNSSVGIKKVLITIKDVYGHPFYLNLTGESVDVPAPKIEISYDGEVLVNGDSTVPVDFGTVKWLKTVYRTVVIRNIGTAELNITGAQIVPITGVMYTLNVTPSLPPDYDIPAGEFKNVKLGLTNNFAISEININHIIKFSHNDLDEGPFVVNLKGMVKNAF